LGLV